MPILPTARAASLLRREDAGRTQFRPAGGRTRGYVVPDAETERRIVRQVRRIRLAQLAAWVTFAAIPIVGLELSDSTDVRPLGWSVVLAVVGATAATKIGNWVQRRLARGLEVVPDPPRLASMQVDPEPRPKPGLNERLPGWIVVVSLVLALGLVVYFRDALPLEALVWLDQHAPKILESKTVVTILESKALIKATVAVGAIAALLIAGAAAALRRGARALRQRR